MGWFGRSYEQYEFEMFSASHFIVLGILCAAVYGLFVFQEQLKALSMKKWEWGIALFLLGIEGMYHIWMLQTGTWKGSHSIPLELCSISLFLAVALLLTHNKGIYEILLFTGLLGASQALATPYLNFDFPHFRFFHFFSVHLLLFCIPLYFTWVKGLKPTIYSVLKMAVFLNVLLPLVMLVNKWTGGNYLYLSHKPPSASLLDVLGPYPLYILSMELLAVAFSLVIWLLFRNKKAPALKKTRIAAGAESSQRKDLS